MRKVISDRAAWYISVHIGAYRYYRCLDWIYEKGHFRQGCLFCIPCFHPVGIQLFFLLTPTRFYVSIYVYTYICIRVYVYIYIYIYEAKHLREHVGLGFCHRFSVVGFRVEGLGFRDIYIYIRGKAPARARWCASLVSPLPRTHAHPQGASPSPVFPTYTYRWISVHIGIYNIYVCVYVCMYVCIYVCM